MRAYPEFVNIFSDVFTTCTNSSLQVLCGLFHITLSEAEVKMPFLKYRIPVMQKDLLSAQSLLPPSELPPFLSRFPVYMAHAADAAACTGFRPCLCCPFLLRVSFRHCVPVLTTVRLEIG